MIITPTKEVKIIFKYALKTKKLENKPNKYVGFEYGLYELNEFKIVSSDKLVKLVDSKNNCEVNPKIENIIKYLVKYLWSLNSIKYITKFTGIKVNKYLNPYEVPWFSKIKIGKNGII